MSRRALMRGVLAGPLGFVCAWLLMAGAALYLPGGAAGIDNIVFPILLFPLFWCALLLYGLLEPKLLRGYALVLLLGSSHGALIASHLMSS